jgi:hypothetical protein
MNAETLFNKSNKRIQIENEEMVNIKLGDEQNACNHIDIFLKMEFEKDTFKFPLKISDHDICAGLGIFSPIRKTIYYDFQRLLCLVIKTYDTDKYELFIKSLSNSEFLLNSRLKPTIIRL